MKLKIGFFAVLLACTLLLNPSPFSLAALCAALLHELGHIAVAFLCSIRLRECKIGIYGAGLMPDSGLYSYRKECLLCLAGPLFNLLCGTLGALLLWDSDLPFLHAFTLTSFSLGILNLLPIRDFDGGRVLYALLCCRLPPDSAGRLLSGFSFCCVLTLWMLSVYLLLRFSSSLSLFVFSVSLFCRIFIPSS